MLPLWDMMARAQNGHGAEILAKQFALSQAQTQAAIDALLPAFSAGLKRNAADPYGLSALLKAVAGGQYAKYFDDASRAFSPQGLADGNTILHQVFGSEELSRAVAAQAAQATGIGQEIMKGMLPVLAAVMAGGFFKQFSGALGQGSNPFAEAFAGMMRSPGTMAGGTQEAGAAPNPFEGMLASNPWTKAFGEMWGVAKPGENAKATSSAGGNPFLAMAEQWMRGAIPAAKAPAPEAASQPSPPANPFADALGQMFETGRKQRDDTLRNMDQLFDQFAKRGAGSV